MSHPVALWAGIECSYSRIGDRYVDQLERSGTYDHPEHIDQLIALGPAAIRFPILWERAESLGDRCWDWVDASLERIREAGIVPIVGLMHHGSGPPTTSLTDPSFPERFAEFAACVAKRYPWVQHYTPINEPLTTARFATLYGHWYPHLRSPHAFARAMILQCRAIARAMRAIREVVPGAQLIQTEDLGETHATESLRYQADFENHRRWLTFDMLAGRVTGEHPMAAHFRWCGVSDAELGDLAAEPCAPDVIGINHYLTSERYLDHRVEHYPAASRGGNGRDEYADVEAIRASHSGVAGPLALLADAWLRYRIPLAVTEVQLACTREQQLRWFAELWAAATTLQATGVDIRAVTAWAALGSHDWGSLLTRDAGEYEPGLFDIRAPTPRKTALGEMALALGSSGTFDHPALDGTGWWQCDRRLTYAHDAALGAHRPDADRRSVVRRSKTARAPRRLLIVGAAGTLGQAVVQACEERHLAYVALPRAELDITDGVAVAQLLCERRPWCIVNCAGFVRVDDAERECESCWIANVVGPNVLARAARDVHAKLVTFSSDLVFDGANRLTPYVESDVAHPLSTYGRTKAESERDLLGGECDALIVRTAAFFADHDEHNFVTRTLRDLCAGRRVVAANDLTVSPTYVPDLVHAVLDLAIDNERGIWHLANQGALTWEDLALRAAKYARVSTLNLCGAPAAHLGYTAARPQFSAMTSERGWVMPSIDHALARYAASHAWERNT